MGEKVNKRLLDEDQRDEMASLIHQGWTTVKIAAYFGVHHCTISRERQRLGPERLDELLRRGVHDPDPVKARLAVLERENRRLRRWCRSLGKNRTALREQVEQLGGTPLA